MRTLLVRRSLLAMAMVAVVPVAARANLPRPTGKVILDVRAAAGAAEAATFDLEVLESLGTIEVETTTPWTEGVIKFEGVPLVRLIDAVAPDATAIEAVAINDYAIQIPVEDARKYDVIVATRMNGQPMSVRDKGPLWVIYPWSSHPELDNATFHARSIWQLRKIALR